MLINRVSTVSYVHLCCVGRIRLACFLVKYIICQHIISIRYFNSNRQDDWLSKLCFLYSVGFLLSIHFWIQSKQLLETLGQWCQLRVQGYQIQTH